MKKFVPVVIVAVVLLVVLVVVMNQKNAGVVGQVTPSAPVPTAVEIQKQKKSAELLKEAQAAYDAKNYEQAAAKTQQVLGSVDNMSQEAKNLLQMSQIRMAQAPVVEEKAPVVEEQASMAEEQTPMTEEQIPVNEEQAQ